MPLAEFTKKLIETRLTEYFEHKILMHARWFRSLIMQRVS